MDEIREFLIDQIKEKYIVDEILQMKEEMETCDLLNQSFSIEDNDNVGSGTIFVILFSLILMISVGISYGLLMILLFLASLSINPFFLIIPIFTIIGLLVFFFLGVSIFIKYFTKNINRVFNYIKSFNKNIKRGFNYIKSKIRSIF